MVPAPQPGNRHFIREAIGDIYEPGFENVPRETPCGNATRGCHIGYVHMDELNLYEIFGEDVLERIPQADLRPGS